MAVTVGTEAVLDAARVWRDRCLIAEGSVFSEARLWTPEHLDELNTHFVENPSGGSGTFLEKFQGQIGPASSEAKKLAAEMLWVMMLFPNNISRDSKQALVRTVWEWSGESFRQDHPLAVEPLRRGIGSGGMGYNTYRWAELSFFISAMREWKALGPDLRTTRIQDGWAFGEWLDTIPGSQSRQLRHMLLHLLFPERYERISSGSHKERVEAAFAPELNGEGEAGESLLARDRRLLQIRRVQEAKYPGQRLDFYYPPLHDRWSKEEEDPRDYTHGGDPVGRLTEPPPVRPDQAVRGYAGPTFPEILPGVRAQGLRITDSMLRRYHLALRARGFVILSGVSGTGKTWLTEAYARAVGARHLIVPVAPNWTTNEDLLGYVNPLDGEYHDTAFSRFLREAAVEYADASEAGTTPRPFHLVLDEMNLARVEYYFARFLSAMEVRARHGTAAIELGPEEQVLLPPNLRFIGTVNVDETTHGFADKVYDRAQLIEPEAPREALAEHLAGVEHGGVLLDIWDAVHGVAPFAFRVVDEIGQYVASAKGTGASSDELLDEQLLQKILPKLKGADPRVGDALALLEELTVARFPLSHRKVLRMRESFVQHGFASYF